MQGGGGEGAAAVAGPAATAARKVSRPCAPTRWLARHIGQVRCPSFHVASVHCCTSHSSVTHARQIACLHGSATGDALLSGSRQTGHSSPSSMAASGAAVTAAGGEEAMAMALTGGEGESCGRVGARLQSKTWGGFALANQVKGYFVKSIQSYTLSRARARRRGRAFRPPTARHAAAETFREAFRPAFQRRGRRQRRSWPGPPGPRTGPTA